MTAKNLLLNGKVYLCSDGESVLQALLRQEVEVPHSCRKQTCLSCLMISLNGTPPAKAQLQLKETQQLQNQFLACGCYPIKDMEIAFPDEAAQQLAWAEIVALKPLNPYILELDLSCEKLLQYRAGQSVMLFNKKNIGKNCAITSPTRALRNRRLEIHLKHNNDKHQFGWQCDDFQTGDRIKLGRITGNLFYTRNHPDQPLLLAAWQCGLSAIIGYIQDLFEQGHSGPVHLFHGVSKIDRLYHVNDLKEISDYFPNFHFIPCVKHGYAPAGGEHGCVNSAIQRRVPDLTGWKVILSGGRDQVNGTKQLAYLSGAKLQEIIFEVATI